MVSITARERKGSLILISNTVYTSVYKLRDWNLNYIHANPLFEGSVAECEEFAKYHEGLW